MGTGEHNVKTWKNQWTKEKMLELVEKYWDSDRSAGDNLLDLRRSDSLDTIRDEDGEADLLQYDEIDVDVDMEVDEEESEDDSEDEYNDELDSDDIDPDGNDSDTKDSGDDEEYLLDLLKDDYEEDKKDDKAGENKQRASDDEDFDKMLDDFIKNSFEKDDDGYDAERKDNGNGEKAVNYLRNSVNNLFFGCCDDTDVENVYMDKEACLLSDHRYLLIQFIHKANEEVYFPLEVQLELPCGDRRKLFRRRVDYHEHSNVYKVFFEIDELFSDIAQPMLHDYLRAKVNMQDNLQSSLPSKSLNIYSGSSQDYLQLTSVGITKTESNIDNEQKRECQVEIKADGLCGIRPQCVMKKLTDAADDLENYVFSLYDDMGRLIDSEDEDSGCRVIGMEDDEVYVSCLFEKYSLEKWDKGYYRIELEWMNEVIASVRLKLGDRDVYGSFDVRSVQPRYSKQVQAEEQVKDAREELDKMVGLASVKAQINRLSEMHRLEKMRQKMGLPVRKVSLHSMFLGNPGTGKTTVARLMGRIYKDMGLLSKGQVVYEERSTLIGRFYDSETKETLRAMNDAKGGILFIDEAYTLYNEEDEKDPGRRVLETLLTALSDENNRDWMLILAGYPKEMERMLNCNQGLRSKIATSFHFDDYNVGELMQIADLYCRDNGYIMTKEARVQLESVVMRDYATRTDQFGNARYVKSMMDDVILPNMSVRLKYVDEPTMEQLQTIEAGDVPSIRQVELNSGYDQLKSMVGMAQLKQNIERHLDFVKMVNMRMQMGLHTTMPPLHMIFSGNPGTGKTTVAHLMGEIYASLGILSKGDVVMVERSNMVGEHVGETEKNMRLILNMAKGNVLFVDEAYQLWNDSKSDFGRIALESLLTELGKESCDMIVILAGYPKEMEELVSMNPGIKSRFPYTFCFEDYTAKELLEIAKMTARREGFHLSPKAMKKMQVVIDKEIAKGEPTMGNGRFVSRLIMTQVIPNMSVRLAKMLETPSKRQLQTITSADIPLKDEELKTLQSGNMNKEAIDRVLAKLDALVGLKRVKKAIHDFADVTRYQMMMGHKPTAEDMLKWSFVGNTGTGKSTVAEIMAELLQVMGVLGDSNVVEIKGEEIFNIPENKSDEILRDAMRKSKYGMLFIDGDSPVINKLYDFGMTAEQLRIKLSSLTAEMGGKGALVIAECQSRHHGMVQSLADCGIYDFDHTLIFEDYTSEELYEILCRCVEGSGMEFSSEAEEWIRRYIDNLCANRNLSFANARTMKLLADTIVHQVYLRSSRDGLPVGEVVEVIEMEDVESFVWRKRSSIGYK